jgi:alpha-galactosidase
MGALGTFIHGNGEKYGLYTSPYTTTCGGFMGSGLFEAADAATFSSWGVDYLKYDGCSVQLLYPSCYATSGPQIWQYMAQQLRLQAHPAAMTVGCVPQGCGITTTLGNWAPSYDWAKDAGQDDVRFNQNDTGGVWATWDSYIDTAAVLTAYGNPGFYMNADYLGNGITDTQKQTQFVMDSMWSSPLIISVDLTTITSPQLAIYTNAAIIAVDQDSAAKVASRVSQSACGSSTCEVWVKPLHDGTYAIALLNRSSSSQTISYTLTSQGVNPTVLDLLAGTNLGSQTSVSATLAAYGIAAFKATPLQTGSALKNTSVIKTQLQ